VGSGAKLPRARLAELSRRGLVTLVREEARPRVGPQLVETAQAVPEATPESLRRAPRQAEVLAWLLARGCAVPVEEVVAAFPNARSHLRALAARGLAKLDQVPAGPAPLAQAPWESNDMTRRPRRQRRSASSSRPSMLGRSRPSCCMA